MGQMAVWCKSNFLALIVVLEHLGANVCDILADLDHADGIFLPRCNKSHPRAVSCASAALYGQRLAVAGVPSTLAAHTRAVSRVLSG